MTPYSLGELAAGHRADLLADAHDAALARAARADGAGPRRKPRVRRPLASALRRLLPGGGLRPRPAA
jgi:hypothetical protein